MQKHTLAINILVAFFSLLTAMAISAYGSDVKSDVDAKAVIRLEKKELMIGDPIRVEVQVEGPEGTKFHWPDIKALLPNFSVNHIEYDVKRDVDGKAYEKCTFEITVYKIGTFDIPSLPIHYEWEGSKNLIQTQPEQIVVQSVLKGENEKLADIKGPIKIAFPMGPVVVWILVALIAVASGIFLIIWIKKRKRKEKIIPVEDIFKGIPPHEWAYSKLDELLGRRLLEKGRYKEFYIILSEILRRYLEGRYRIETMERTTSEIQDNMTAAKIERHYCNEALLILEDCDLVKFAKYIPTHDSSKMSIQRLYSFIDQTKPLEKERTLEKSI